MGIKMMYDVHAQYIDGLVFERYNNATIQHDIPKQGLA
jgi:hypothetical protein